MPIESIMSSGQTSDISDQISRRPHHSAGGPTESEEQSLTEAGFFWRERDGVRVLVCRALEDAGFINGFSTRVGGVSPFPSDALNLAGYDEDTADNVEENRRRFLSALDAQHSLTTVWQVHGDTIKTVSDAQAAALTDERADAIVSNLPQLLAGVKTADCVPILIGDRVKQVYSAIHAGWRGTSLSIAEKTVRKMSGLYGCRHEDIVTAIGPAAMCRKYEIGQDVMDAFADIPDRERYFTPTREGHWLVDLIAANRDQLTSAGLLEENIHISPFCTIERTDLFFSYRIEKKRFGKTGRLLSVIGRK